MPGNIWGTYLRLSTFGESHGAAIGGILEGFPAGISIDTQLVQRQLDLRKPGQSRLTTQRKESDTVEFLSGIYEGKTTGTPIGFTIANDDAKSKDYSHLKEVYRPSHADKTYADKYGHRDHRGGGRASARETAVRVAAGALAQQLIQPMKCHAYVSAVGSIHCEKTYQELNLNDTYQSPVRCPHPDTARAFEELILKTRKEGDTVGGIITGVIPNVPPGLGEPVFDKLHAQLGKAMLSINAVKGFEYGSGFAGTQLKGSQHNDLFTERGNTRTNHSGGVQGGISNGEDIYYRVAFKPVATLMRNQDSINAAGEKTVVQGKGRHDPCVLPRAVPIVQAMAALTLADFYLQAKANQI